MLLYFTLICTVFMLLWLKMLILAEFVHFDSSAKCKAIIWHSTQIAKARPRGKTQIKTPTPRKQKLCKSSGEDEGTN